MPVLKPPKPGGGLRPDSNQEEVWTIILKPGEVLDVKYE